MTTKNIPRVSFTVMEKQMTQMLRFKVKITPNKTTVRKMLQALFLQHFNGFILHVCQEIYIIFSKINFFPLEYCYCFVVTARQQVHCQKPPVYTAESCSNESVFWVFSTKSEQTAIQQSHIINPLLTSFARSVRESIAFGFYRTDLATSSLGLYENLDFIDFIKNGTISPRYLQKLRRVIFQ